VEEFETRLGVGDEDKDSLTQALLGVNAFAGNNVSEET